MATRIDNPFTDTFDLADGSNRAPARRVSADRLLAVSLIGIQLFLLAGLSGARLFPVVTGCVAAWGLVTRVRIRIEPMAMKLVYAMMLIGFLVHHMAAPFPLPPDYEFIRSDLAHSLARLLITIQVLQLYLFQPRGRLPVWIAACGAVAVAFAADVSIPEEMHFRLLGIIAGFVAFFAMFGNHSRTPVSEPTSLGLGRVLLLTAALAGALSMGSAAAWAMRKHERTIESFLADHLGYGGHSIRAGFSPSGQLESVTQWKAHGADRVMLRIFADSPPGYLRGKAFDTYQGSSYETSYTAWTATTPRRPLRPADPGRTPSVRAGDRIYDLSPSQPLDLRVLDVWPEEGTKARIFAPLTATRLGINAVDVGVDGHDVVTFNDGEFGRPYIVFDSMISDRRTLSGAESPSPEYRRLLTTLDRDVGDEVRDLAVQLFAGCRTTAQKLDAVTRYFHENYTYRLGIDVPHREDPVTYFLTKQPPAHCEYFATGTAVLLRLADVPCRYVVGYVSQERNPVGGFWVARNKDAHAWVEAFDEDEQQWVVVESTPSDGVPQERESHLASQLLDSVRHRLSILRIRIREYGLLPTLLAGLQLIWSIPGLTVLLGLFAVMLVRYRPATLPFRRRERSPVHLREMHAALSVLDRRARERGFERSPEETLTRFAERLRESAVHPNWATAAAASYALYVELRYQPQLSPDAVDSFRRSVEGIPRLAGDRTDRE